MLAEQRIGQSYMTDSYDNNPLGGIASIPDFSHEALAHLQVQSDAIRLHVQAFLEISNDANRAQLQDDFQRFRNTLVLLDKGAAVYVAEELIQLLDSDATGNIGSQAELARVLVQAADQLSSHVALLQQDGNLDSALPLLTLVNDSRACREDSLLSEMVVLAAGIEVPSAKTTSVTDKDWQQHRDAWVSYTSDQHAILAQRGCCVGGEWKTQNLLMLCRRNYTILNNSADSMTTSTCWFRCFNRQPWLQQQLLTGSLVMGLLYAVCLRNWNAMFTAAH